MIVPNLMVADLARSIAFYRDVIGMIVTMTVDAERNWQEGGDGTGAVFATLEWEGGQLMLQTVESLSADLPALAPLEAPSVWGTIYFRGLHPSEAAARVAPDRIVKGPELSWYGMMEVYLRDPDGHVICLGAPEGAGPG